MSDKSNLKIAQDWAKLLTTKPDFGNDSVAKVVEQMSLLSIAESLDRIATALENTHEQI